MQALATPHETQAACAPLSNPPNVLRFVSADGVRFFKVGNFVIRIIASGAYRTDASCCRAHSRAESEARCERHVVFRRHLDVSPDAARKRSSGYINLGDGYERPVDQDDGCRPGF